METVKPKIIKEKVIELILENFYKKYFKLNNNVFKRISLQELEELKKREISTEKFLNYIHQKHGVLFHGSVYKISGNQLRPHHNRVFATDNPAIAIMRSIYSNIGVILEYPDFINEENKLVLKIHTPKNGDFIKTNIGFIYILNKIGFENKPESSW